MDVDVDVDVDLREVAINIMLELVEGGGFVGG